MKVKLTTWNCKKGEYSVKLIQGVQSFTLDYRGNKTEASWYARMFRRALKAAIKEAEK